MDDIILGGPSRPLYEIDDISMDLLEFDKKIYDIINFLSSKYEISEDKIVSAYQAFIKETGYNQIFLENNANIIKDTEIALTDAITLYVSLLIGITLVIIIWVLCIIGLYDWIIALILTIVILFFIFILSFAYRSKTDRIINEQNSKLKNESQQALDNFQNSITHWPQGLYNVLIAITKESKQELKPDIKISDIKNDCGCKR